jgi:hypothetical protein
LPPPPVAADHVNIIAFTTIPYISIVLVNQLIISAILGMFLSHLTLKEKKPISAAMYVILMRKSPKMRRR